MIFFHTAYAIKAEDILSDNQSHFNVGETSARKGSIAATIANVTALNHFIFSQKDVHKELQSILKDQKELIAALHITGMFDLFKLEEWLNPVHGEGRCWVAVLYLQEYPEKMNNSIKEYLKLYNRLYSPLLIEEISKL